VERIGQDSRSPAQTRFTAPTPTRQRAASRSAPFHSAVITLQKAMPIPMISRRL
jgi:hypothetical protein